MCSKRIQKFSVRVKTHFHTDSRCTGRSGRRGRSTVARHSNRSTVRPATSCGPSDTGGNCTAIPAAGPDTNTIGTGTPTQSRRRADRPAPMSLAAPCPCSSGCRRIGRPFRPPLRCAAPRSCGYFCTLATASGTDSRSSPSPGRLPAAQIARSSDDPSRSAHISGYCSRIRRTGTQIVSGIRK